MTKAGPHFVRRCLKFYLRITVLLWLIAFAGLAFRAYKLHVPASVDSLFIFERQHSYSDFLDFDPEKHRFRPETQSPPLVYPALAICFYIAITGLVNPALYYFLSFALCTAFASAGYLISYLRRSIANRCLLTMSVVASVILSYPLMVVIERGNIESFVWFFEMTAIMAFAKRRFAIAAALIAVAASMKIYPGILFLLFLRGKRFRALSVGLTMVLILNIGSLWVIGPDIPRAYSEVQTGIATVGHNHMMRFVPYESWFDHSLFGVVKLAVAGLHRFKGEETNTEIAALAKPYAVAVLLLFASLYIFRIRRLPLLNQVISLICLSVSAPFLSFEYTLLHLYIAWACLLLFLSQDVTPGHVPVHASAILGMFGCFALLFAPEGFLRFNIIGLGGQLKAIWIIGLIYFSVRAPMPSSLFGDVHDFEVDS